MPDKSNDLQIRFITRVVASACLCSMLLCNKLWLSDRSFPLSPVIRFLPAVHHPFDFIIYGGAVILLVCIILVRNSRNYIIAFSAVSVLLCLLDQNRWQPWFYQYVMMFFVLSC